MTVKVKAIFSKQPIFCCVCGKKHSTDGIVCSTDCYIELEWRKALSILGEEYSEDPRKKRKK